MRISISRDYDREPWWFRQIFSLFALVLTAAAVVVQVSHQSVIPDEVWRRPYVELVERLQVADQVASFVILLCVLVFGIRGTRGMVLRLICALMSAVSVYVEMHLLTYEYPGIRGGPAWPAFSLLGTLGCAGLFEIFGALLIMVEDDHIGASK